jgi:ADP-heptose:LPS heptosyltransferase
LPGRMPFTWPKEIRHRYMNVNYAEHIHLLAGVPMPPRDKFYPTPHELKWAEKQRRRIPGKVVLWTLAGSAVHKHWPFLDKITARIMLEYKDVYVVMVGDALCQMVEAGWENEPRVLQKSGEWSIRQTLSFAGLADLVIGPETGVMASVAMREVPKIIFLSHASVENLTKYWINCVSMEPRGCDCYPCHQLHYGFDPCPRNIEHGAAECQVKIDPERVWATIKNILERIG